jgi:hypothetical protein
MHPPRPRLTVRVGVAGHRWDKLKRKDIEAIRQRLNQVFDSIEDVVNQVLADPEAGYLDPDSGQPADPAVLRLLSGLAEGTDRVGAQVARARKRKWLLTAMLPFQRDQYVLDFKTKKQLPDGTEVPCQEGEFGYGEPDTASVQEFQELLHAAEAEGGVQELDGEAGKHGAYRQLASALCLNSDVVIAIWDEMPARPGGTGDIVRLAGDYGIPVVRIPMDGVGNPWLHDPGAEEGGRGLGLRPLAEHFRRLLVAPKPSPEDEKEADNPRESYFHERVRSRSSGRIYDLFFSILAPKGRPGPKPVSTGAPPSGALKPPPPPSPPPADEAELEHIAALRQRWERDWAAQGASAELCAALTRTGIYRHYAWASHLANYNGGRYRSAFLLNYMLSWLAVGAAAAGIAFEQAGRPALVQAAAVVEVFFLSCIMGIVWYTGRHRFHTQWLDCRRLAEWIRLLPMLLPLSRTPVLGVESNPVLSSQESWVDWMFRAVVREAGVLPLDVSRQLTGARGILATGVLDGQIDYHARTARRNGRVDAILHWITKAAFGLALVLAVYHLALVFGMKSPVSESMGLVLLGLILVIPAFGGAMHGLRSQGDYEATAIRSRRIQERLMELKQELGELRAPSVSGMAEIAVKTASVMSAELSAWLVAYQSKAVQAA